MQDPSGGLTDKMERMNFASILAMDLLTFSDIDHGKAYCSSCQKTLQAHRTKAGSLAAEEPEAKEIRPCLLGVDDDPSVAGLLGDVFRSGDMMC